MAENPVIYTKQGTDKAIARAVAPLATKEALEPLATKDELAKVAAGGKVDLTEYAKKTDLAPLATKTDLAGYATIQQVADMPNRADLAGYATKADVAGVAHTSDLAPLATKTELTDALKSVGIKICATQAEAQALPDGTLYFLAAGATKPPPPPTPGPATGPTIVTATAGQIVGQTITITTDGKTGDKAIIGLNTKATAQSHADLTLPQGWQTLVQPYWVGTMRFTLITGPWAPTLSLSLSQNAEIGWGAAIVRDTSTIEAGTVKKRQADPLETTTCTAPALAGNGLVTGWTFERTSGNETSEQIIVSQGWEKIAYAAQQGANYQTVTIAKRTGTEATDLRVTYPNAQGSNGAGVQVIARA